MASEADDQRLREVIQSWPQAPGQALEQLKPLAAEGNIRAIVLLAVMLLQGEQFEEAVVYARQAIQAGAGAVAQIFAADFAARGREDLRSKAPEFISSALEAGWNIDIRNLLVNAASEGKAEVAWELLDLALEPVPLNARKRWEELVAKTESDGAQIASAAGAVAGQREIASQQINDEIGKARETGGQIERLANDLGVLANKAGAISLAEAYSERAEQEESLGHRYTLVSLGLGAATVVIIAVIAALTLKEHTSVTTAAQRAAFGLPLALLAAYVNRLASAYRNQAWKLRHVELQLRTVNPFLAGLEDQHRKAVLADLALRFFPGHQTNSEHYTDDRPSEVNTVQLNPEQLLGILMRVAQGGPLPAAVSAEPSGEDAG
jgi:hypothetical protein